MQFIVIADTSKSMPQISNMQSVPTNSGGYPYVILSPNQNYQLHLLASDADINDIVNVIAFGEPFDLTNSPATLSVNSTGNGNEVQATFSWTPDVSAVRVNPYLAVFRVSDQMFYFDETIQFEVSMVSNIEDNFSLKQNAIYPNPVNNRMYIPININEEKIININIYNILGKRVYQSGRMNLQAGEHLILKETKLESGQYFVNISDNYGNIIKNERVVVVK